MQRVDLGFQANDVVTMEMRLLNPKYRQNGAIAAFHEQLMSRVRAIPGAGRAALTTSVPMRGVDSCMSPVRRTDGRTRASCGR